MFLRVPNARLGLISCAAMALAACSGSDSTSPSETRGEVASAFAKPSFAVSAATNLIQNPALETSGSNTSPANWSSSFWGTTPSFSYPVSGRSGRGASVTLKSNSTGDARWQHAVVAVSPGARYTFSIWYKSTTTASLIAAYTNASGGMSYYQLASTPASKSWIQQTSTFTVPAGAVNVTIYEAISRSGSLTIDDASLVALDAPPPSPTVTLSSSPSTISVGQSSTLTWSSTNATTCAASGAWSGAKSASGSQVVTPSASGTYTLACTGSGGTATQSVAVTVETTTPPTGPFTEGMVSLTFDDAWESQYFTALPILETAGLKGTFYLTTLAVEQSWYLFMTPAAVLDIAAKGHEIAGHTLVHPDLNAISLDSVRTEVTASKAYLENLTGKTVTSFAYPYGNNTPAIQTLLGSVGYTSARTVVYSSQNVATTNKFALNSMCIEPTNTVPVIKAQIDAAMANKTWFILCFHDVKTGGDNLSITPTDFQQIVDYLKARGTKMVTVAQGRALMAP